MHKSATKCKETVGKWCKKKHGASKIIDTLETYHPTAPSPLTGANTVAVPPRPANPKNQSNAGNAGINQVDQSYNPEFYTGGPAAGWNEYKEHNQSYVVFETERTDKQSLYWRSLEVNVVMLTVPKLMYWSDQVIG
jgi:hypothetical protein